MTKKKIESLTSSQERELVQFRARMWERGTSCDPCDRRTAEAAISDAYKEIGKKPPRFFWMTSPMTCALGLQVLRTASENSDGLSDGLRAGLSDGLRDGLGDGLGDTWWWGQMDTYWLAYFRFATDLGCDQKPEHIRRLAIMERISASCGFWYPRDGICLVSDRFLSVSWDEARNQVGLPFRLHSADGMAVQFRDQWGMYYWHNYRIPPSHEWIISHKSRLTPAAIDLEKNAELRRIMLEIYGFDRYFAERDATVIANDIDGNGHPRRLLSAKVGDETIRVVEVLNGSLEPDGTRRKFILGAMPGTTPHEVIAASYGLNPAKYREAVRT